MHACNEPSESIKGSAFYDNSAGVLTVIIHVEVQVRERWCDLPDLRQGVRWVAVITLSKDTELQLIINTNTIYSVVLLLLIMVFRSDSFT